MALGTFLMLEILTHSQVKKVGFHCSIPHSFSWVCPYLSAEVIEPLTCSSLAFICIINPLKDPPYAW